MKILAPACVAFSFLLAFACDRAPTSSGTADIAIHLLADDTITAYAAATLPLNNLSLADKPLISGDDITGYNWSEHTFTLSVEKENELKDYESLPGKSFGIPLVVIAGGERIYMGALWYGYSSLMPSYPYITVTPLILKIDLNELVETDPRNDPRIYQTLKDAGVLTE